MKAVNDPIRITKESQKGFKRTITYTPAVTRVAACIKAETGVGLIPPNFQKERDYIIS
jgi:hypothetical protein